MNSRETVIDTTIDKANEEILIAENRPDEITMGGKLDDLSYNVTKMHF